MRVELGEDGGAPPGRMIPGLGLALEQQDVGQPADGEEVGEGRPRDPPADDDDLVALGHAQLAAA
jgi:hypothetical protein